MTTSIRYRSVRIATRIAVGASTAIFAFLFLTAPFATNPSAFGSKSAMARGGGGGGGGGAGGGGGGAGGGNGGGNGGGQGQGQGHGPDNGHAGGFGAQGQSNAFGQGTAGGQGNGFGHGGKNGLGAHPSDLGKLNAAHASPTALENAAPNSAVGMIADYKEAIANGTVTTISEAIAALSEFSNKEVNKDVVDAVNAILESRDSSFDSSGLTDDTSP